MKNKTRIILIATLGLSCAGYAESPKEFVDGIFAQTNHTPKILLDVRARYEFGDQQNLDPANAATIRARLGLESQDYNGFSGLVEFEGTRALSNTDYNSAVNGETSKTVIADPESTELNRLQLQFKRDGNQLILGRQRIILDNARFVGNVGWRQNEQTFDAFSYKNTMIEDVALYYAYLNEVNRIFGSDAPSRGATADFDSNSHLINASFDGFENQKLVAYAYLLDFDNSNLNSSDTFGGSWSITGKVAENYTLKGYLEAAYQTDAGDNPVSYDALYYHLAGSVGRDGYTAEIGYEVLGSDDGNFGFRTPLATAHKFNGWNDQFLVTPANGLRDFYAGIGLPVPHVPVKLIYHYFSSDENSIDYGQEIDAIATYKINDNLNTIAKYSFFDAEGDVPAYSSDRHRFSIEMNYTY